MSRARRIAPELRGQSEVAVTLNSDYSRMDYSRAGVECFPFLPLGCSCALCGRAGGGSAVRVTTYYGAVMLHATCITEWAKSL